jgi:hypothetical protein
VTESPAALIRRAAALMRERAEAASRGPWHQICLGSEGCQVINDGRLRDRKHVSFSGRKEWKADHADAVYIAGMHPLVALAVADLLESAAVEIDDGMHPGANPGSYGALAVAHAYLNETDETTATTGKD